MAGTLSCASPLSPPRAALALRRRCGRRRAAASARPRAALPDDDAPLTRRAFDAAGAWLVAHPAPLWLVNNPVKRWVASQSAGSYDVAATRAELEALIAADGVVLFSATYCPFSARAKAELRANAVPFTAHEHNLLPNGRALVAELGTRTGRTSIPSIFIAGVAIGGCNDGTPGLRPLIAAGGLEAALAKCAQPEWQERRRQALADAARSSA